MVQEKKMESRLGPLDVILYVAILCVHYPLRIVLASYRLIKATIVKAALIPRLILGYTTALLTIILESSEKKIIEILNVLASLPSYLLKKANQYTKLVTGKKSEISNDPKTGVKEEKDLTNYTELFTSLVKKASDTVYGFLVAFANVWRHILLLPLKLSLFPLKVAKNLITTLLNLPSDQKTEMDRGERRSLATHLGDYLFIVLANLQYYLIYVIAIIERLMSQLSSLARTTPRHIFDLIKIIYLRLLQFVAVTVIFLYNVGRYSFFYVFIFVSRALSRRRQGQVTESTAHTNSSSEDLEVLVQENSKLKEALARAKTKNENHKCEQQIKDLEGQLGEIQVAFDKERQEYKREIDKLKQSNKKSSDFNSERTKLQSEIHKLQGLIAEVQKENEEEGRIKKQEAIDLDNERNQLQEQIQTLQLQVVALQKQNEAQASSRKQMEIDFEKEREDLLQEIEHLQKRVEEMEDAQNEGKNNDHDQVSEMKNNRVDSINKAKKKVNSAY
ncbi:hypothetical protein RI129_010404 [Pyrocoelia pectoralis]|uniref:Uncharacterized protein n=1 Tax=Pyrocoelia pectoralis TaxID=417401 RepID=A0AAN7ZH15_9COLE